MNFKLLLFFVLFCSNLFGQMVFTVSINTSGFSNEFNVPTNGMNFGILVDTNNDGFLGGSYLDFDFTVDNQFLKTQDVVTDDLFLTPLNNFTTTFSTFLGDGTIGVNDYNLIDGTTGNSFSVVWNEPFSKFYGLTENDVFKVVGQGEVTPLPEINWDPGYAQYSFVPEPSVVTFLISLLLFGVVIINRKIKM